MVVGGKGLRLSPEHALGPFRERNGDGTLQSFFPVLAGRGPIGLCPSAREIAVRSSSFLTKTAFDNYLRYGLIHPSAPTTLDFKQARPTTHYDWRTRRDGRVRPSHAENDGKLFAWDNPPPTGHPRDAPGCRCTTEPN